MTLRLTPADWRAIFPRAPQAVIDAFASPAGTAVLQKAGITDTRTRLAFALANVEHECGGFTIPHLTENINYTAERMAQVWPNRFPSAAAVRSKYGTAPGWQKKAFDDIYGNRMGNRPGTHDGSTFIGRGGPQVTGRDGYAAVGQRCGLDLVNNPELTSAPEHQPAILAAFWTWKVMNRFADRNDFLGAVKAWNGGSNGMADRQHQMAGNDPIIKRLQTVDAIAPKVKRVEAGKPAEAPAPKPAAPAAPTTVQTKKEDAKAGGIGAAILAALAAVWAFAQEHLLAVLIGLAVFVVVGLVAYRLIKKRWPWTSLHSTGVQLPGLLPHLHLNLGPFSERPSAGSSSLDLGQELEAASEALRAVQSPPSSESKPPPKRSARPSQKTRKRTKSSNSSKRSAAKKSRPKRKSKSPASTRQSKTTR